MIGNFHDEWYQYWPWIYVESNDEAGLQRDDDYCTDVRQDGSPYTPSTADTHLF